LELTAQCPIKDSISVNFQQFSIFPKKNPNFGVFAKNLSKVRLWKLSLFCSPVSPSWAESDLIPLPPAPMNHVKYLRAGPAEMRFQNWYTANTNHFRLTDSVRWKSKTQLG